MTSVIGQLILGWLLADFLSGLFHWLEDRFGMPTTPLIGKWIIAPNRDHHARPTAFVDEGSFTHRNLAMINTSLVIGGGLIFALGLQPWIASLMVGGAFVNEVHAWAHRPTVAPRWARVLQQTGFIQSPKGHATHHRPPQDKHYCILTDWLNPLLDAVGVWSRAERFVGRKA